MVAARGPVMYVFCFSRIKSPGAEDTMPSGRVVLASRDPEPSLARGEQSWTTAGAARAARSSRSPVQGGRASVPTTPRLPAHSHSARSPQPAANTLIRSIGSRRRNRSVPAWMVSGVSRIRREMAAFAAGEAPESEVSPGARRSPPPPSGRSRSRRRPSGSPLARARWSPRSRRAKV